MYDYEQEPKPVKVTGLIGRAWARVLVGAEWFDGEDAIAFGAQERLFQEWLDNAPSRVTIHNFDTGSTSHRYFATRIEAEEYVDGFSLEPEMVTIVPVSRITGPQAGAVPYQYR